MRHNGSVVMLSVIMLSVVMLHVSYYLFKLSVVMLSAMTPNAELAIYVLKYV
jgi:hypothetical protein